MLPRGSLPQLSKPEAKFEPISIRVLAPCTIYQDVSEAFVRSWTRQPQKACQALPPVLKLEWVAVAYVAGDRTH